MNRFDPKGVAAPTDRVGAVRRHTARRSVRVIWAEKTAFALILAEVGLITTLWLITVLAAGEAGANHVFASIGTWRVGQRFLLIVLLWISFRVMDFIAGGSTYRLFYQPGSRGAHSAFPAGNNQADVSKAGAQLHQPMATPGNVSSSIGVS